MNYVDWSLIVIAAIEGLIICGLSSKQSALDCTHEWRILHMNRRAQENAIEKISHKLPYDDCIGKGTHEFLEHRVRELEYLVRDLQEKQKKGD